MPDAVCDRNNGLARTVDQCYRPAAFAGERQRVEYLFDLYQKLIAPLTAATKPKRGRKSGA